MLSNPATQQQCDSYGEQGQRGLVNGMAMRRLGHPADIANVLLPRSEDRPRWWPITKTAHLI
jgi:3-oxoacyl-[acyl-carrier protein] reductase